MKKMSLHVVLVTAILVAGAGAAEPGSPFAARRYRFDAGKNVPALYYDAIRPIETGSMADVAVVLIHGWGGHVRTVYPAFADALAARAGTPEKTPYLIAPMFPRRETMAKNGEPDDGRAVWGDSWANEDRHPDQMGAAADDWRGGGDANGTSFSSYDYIDAIFARLADRKSFPNLRRVVLAGFSAGGQFAGRYAAIGKGKVRDGVTVVYMDMAPSTEFRFEKDDPWLYGLKGRPRYGASLTDDEIMANLCSRRVWHGCGSLDVKGRPHTSLDMTPPAVRQGTNRLERFRSFQKYLDKYPAWKRQASFHVFEGIGHQEDLAYPTKEVLDFVFETGGGMPCIARDTSIADGCSTAGCGETPRFACAWSHRYVFEAERPLPDGCTFLPAAHYSAKVISVPSELRFVRGGETILAVAAPTNVVPPYDLHVLVQGRTRPPVFVTKGGRTALAGFADWPAGFDPRAASLTNALQAVASPGMEGLKASQSAGIGQADTRFVTYGRTNRPYVRDGRLYFTFSARGYGSHLGVMSVDPDKRDFRLEGTILFGYGDGLLRNDVAADLFYDDVAGEWRAYVSNFSTAGDTLRGRAPGGVNVAWSKACPLHGLSVMKAKSLGLKGMNEDPDGYWDASARKWRLLVSKFTPKGIRAAMLESEAWDGPFRPLAGPVAEDSTGTTLAFVDGTLRALAGSASRRFIVYSYPMLEKVGELPVAGPPWEVSASRNGRSWPAYLERDGGRRLILTFDRVNFAGMPKPNWTYGGLYLYERPCGD